VKVTTRLSPRTTGLIGLLEPPPVDVQQWPGLLTVHHDDRNEVAMRIVPVKVQAQHTMTIAGGLGKETQQLAVRGDQLDHLFPRVPPPGIVLHRTIENYHLEAFVQRTGAQRRGG